MLRTNIAGHITNIRPDERCFSAELPPRIDESVWIGLPETRSGGIACIPLGGQPSASPGAREDGRIDLERPNGLRQRITVVFA